MSLSREQELEIREAFSLFDADGNGTIDASELRIAMKALGLESSRTDVSRLIAEVGTHSDSVITFDEFRQMMARKLANRDPTEEMTKAFELFDHDGNGYIDLEDIKKVTLELGETISDEELKEILDEADLDGDGRLTLKDWIKVMSKTSLYS
ncbi:hypothetical protein RCL1_004855 [Eukaryota sp. TZLM3-RCL]